MDLRSDTLNIISLCTGGGGLDRAVELAIPSARPVACVEREAFAVANLVSQMQRGIMAQAPIHGDVRTFPGRRFRGGVDGVIGGIPCQPYSLAGKRLGRNDERDLWGAARRIFVQSGAWFILIENVGGMLSEGGAERVRRDLRRLGCSLTAGLFRASEVGLPHERERLFMLGVLDDASRRRERGVGRDMGGAEGAYASGKAVRANGNASPSDSRLADAGDTGLQGRELDRSPDGGDWTAASGSAAELRGARLADTNEPVVRGVAPARRQPILQCDDGTGGNAAAELADTNSAGSSALQRNAGEVSCLQEAERQPEYGAALPGGGGAELGQPSRSGQFGDAWRGTGEEPADGHGQLADALSRGHDGRPCEPEWSEEERAAVEWASRGPLFAAGPGNVDAWRWIMERAPERLPTVSRRDLFFHAIRKTRSAADRDPSKRGDLDPQGPFGLRASVIQALAQSHLRRGSHGVAARIDELRMLGNGVADLAGAHAVRTLATDLSPRSAGAAELCRLMNLHPHDHREAV